MKLNMKSFIATIVVTAGAAGFAQAATATFDLSQSPLAGTRSAYSSNAGDGGTLAITGTRYRGSKVYSTPNARKFGVLQKSAKGLGLAAKRRDSWKIDGKGRDELAVLSFGQEVSLSSITFGSVSKRGNAKFQLFTFNDGVWEEVAGKLNKRGNGRTQTFVFEEEYSGSVFGIGAKGKKTAFSILSVETKFDLEQEPGSDVSAVPLPAGGLLLLTGIVGFGAARRKKRS